MFKFVSSEIQAWLEAFVRFLLWRLGNAMRRLWFRRRFQKSDKVHIGFGCEFIGPRFISLHGTTFIGNYCYFHAGGGTITVGDWTAFNHGVHINASVGGNIVIGTNCPIGPGVVMRTANHKYTRPDMNIQNQGHDIADIVIENDIWIGANALILGGRTLAKLSSGVVCGAGTVVTLIKSIYFFQTAKMGIGGP